MKKLLIICCAVLLSVSVCLTSAEAAMGWYECRVINAGENMAIGSAVLDIVSVDGSFSGGRALSLSPYSGATVNRIMAAALTAVSSGKTLMVAFDPDAGDIVVPIAVYVRD